MKFFITFNLLMIFFINIYAQPISYKKNYNDSISLKYIKGDFHSFGLLTKISPIVLFQEGLFMPNEKMWYYTVKPPIHIEGFSISMYDTSLYLILKKDTISTLFRLKNNTITFKEERKELLKLNYKETCKIYPIGRLMFYLLKNGIGSNVSYYNGVKEITVLKTKEYLRNIIVLDESSFFAYTAGTIYYITKQKKPIIIYQSKSPIISVAINDKAVFYISTYAGIYTLKNNKTPVIFDVGIKDADLLFYNNLIYVHSNRLKSIYIIK